MEIEKIKLNDLDEYHMLRHFDKIDLSKINNFKSLGFSPNDIEKQLNGLAEAQIRNGYLAHIISGITERRCCVCQFDVSVSGHK